MKFTATEIYWNLVGRTLLIHFIYYSGASKIAFDTLRIHMIRFKAINFFCFFYVKAINLFNLLNKLDQDMLYLTFNKDEIKKKKKTLYIS
jgi:hypothetical protein